MPSRNRCALGFAGLLTLALPLCARAQQTSPCDSGSGTLIRDWQAEGVPGTEGRLARSSLECAGNGTIRQVVEVSEDGGRTWRVLFESTYAPAPAPPVPSAVPAATPAVETGAVESPPAATPPAPEAPLSSSEPTTPPPATPMPSAAPPEPQPSGAAQHQAARQVSEQGSEVQAVSRELEREEIPESEAPELVMASPMILEITPGEVDEYPEGTAWSTEETSGFICGQVVIRRATVGRTVKRGRTSLEVGTYLFTKRRQRNVDLLIEVLLDGQVVASEQLSKVPVGLNIPGHGKEGLPVGARFDLDGDSFERLFADGADRRLRLTLTVPPAG